MASPNHTLLMQLGPSRGKSISVHGREFVLGRDPASDWVIEDIEVSRRHARLIAQQGKYAIEDLGSTNGTFVNGQRIRAVQELDPGATIRLGENVLFFYDVTLEKGAIEDTEGKKEAPVKEATVEEAPQVELLERVETEEPPASHPPSPGPAKPQPLAQESPPSEVPFFRQPWVLAVAALALLGICALTAFLWYVDANFLWCDVFGSLIASCR